MQLKLFSLLFFSNIILTACAGGGMAEPKVPVSIPTLPDLKNFKAVTNGPKGNLKDLATIHTNPGSNLSFGSYTGTYLNWLGEPDNKTDYVYQAPSGKTYEISSYNSPIIASISLTRPFPTSQEGQPLEGGGRLLICCHDTGKDRSFPATNHDYLRFGAWIGANGESDLFVGGFPVGKAGIFPDTSKPKGKATYEVWAIRIKNGKFVTSSYSPEYQNTKPLFSQLTANFNTNKLGGSIIGNTDYGADVIMKDVDINGIDFKGTAESNGTVGKVEGKFFGKFDSTWEDDLSIGGKVTFNSDKSLDTVFAGQRRRVDENTQSQDLEPLK